MGGENVETIVVALIVAAAAVIGPLLVARQRDKRLDRKLEQNNKRLDAIGQVASTTLEKVRTVERHTDGTLTAAFRAELAAVDAQAAAMRRPAPDTWAAIQATEARAEVLRRNLAERERATAAAQKLIANGAQDVEGPGEPG